MNKMNRYLKYATQDNEQTYKHQYVYEVSVIGCEVYHSKLGNGVAKMNRPRNKEKKTWWIEEVAKHCNKEFTGKKKNVVFCATWDEFIDRYLGWFDNFCPQYLFAHSLNNDHNFWKRTQCKFGQNKRMNAKTHLDNMFTMNSWKNCQKVCSQYLFDKELSPKFCKTLCKNCSFVRTDRSSLEWLMRWYHNDVNWTQSHTSYDDAMDLFRLVRLRMIVDGTKLPQSLILNDHLKTISIK